MGNVFGLRGAILNFLDHESNKYPEGEVVTKLAESCDEHAGPIGRELSRLMQEGMVEADKDTNVLRLCPSGKAQREKWLEEERIRLEEHDRQLAEHQDPKTGY